MLTDQRTGDTSLWLSACYQASSKCHMLKKPMSSKEHSVHVVFRRYVPVMEALHTVAEELSGFAALEITEMFWENIGKC